MTETERKHKLLRLVISSVLSNVPMELRLHLDEIDEMRELQGWTWEKTDWSAMASRFKDRFVYQWCVERAKEIWEGNLGEWYFEKLKPWLDHDKIEI